MSPISVNPSHLHSPYTFINLVFKNLQKLSFHVFEESVNVGQREATGWPEFGKFVGFQHRKHVDS